MGDSVTILDAAQDPKLVALKRHVQKELEAVRASFLIRRPFLAQMALQLDLISVVDDRILTAATNGDVIYFDARFYESCSPAKREFIFAHEVWHCALGHMSRVQKRDRHIWNLATDHEVNVLLSDDNFKAPDDAVLFRRLVGLNAEEVYARLLEGRDDLGRMQTLDVHLPIGEFSALDSPDHKAGTPTTITLDRDVRITDAAPSPFEADARTVDVARRVARLYGTLPGAVAARVEALTKPRVDWRVVFAQFLERSLDKSFSWNRPQRRLIHSGLHLPSRNSHTAIRQVVVAIDVSGSALSLASRFLSEVRGMLQQVAIDEIDLLFFDTRICHRTSVTTQTSLQSVLGQIKAGGGTAFEPVFEEIESRSAMPSLLVVLTDGAGSAPSAAPRYPVIWALTEDGRSPTNWGRELWIQNK